MRSPGTRLAGVVAAAVAGVVLSACAPSPGATVTAAGQVDAAAAIRPIDAGEPVLPVQAPSLDGTTTTVTDVSRIVPLNGAIAEVVFSLGLGENVVARDVEATFPEAEHLPLVTTGHDVSPEGVVSLRPTVVIADARTGPPEALTAISRAGIPVVVVPEAWTMGDTWARMAAVSEAVGLPDAGETLIARTRAELDAAAPPLDGDPPVVAFLYLRGTAGVYLLGGEGSGADELIDAVGGIDAGAAAGLGSFTPLTSEALVEAAPDVLLVMTRGLDSVGGIDGLVELPGIAQTPAGRDRAVIAIEDGRLLSFGPRTPEVLGELRAGLDALR